MLFEEMKLGKVFLIDDEELKSLIQKSTFPEHIKLVSDFKLFLTLNEELQKAKIIVLVEGICFEITDYSNFISDKKVLGYLDDKLIECPIILNIELDEKENKSFKMYNIYQDYDTHYINSYECLIEDNNECRKLLLKEIVNKNNIFKTKTYTTTIIPKEEYQKNNDVLQLVLEKNTKFRGFSNKT